MAPKKSTKALVVTACPTDFHLEVGEDDNLKSALLALGYDIGNVERPPPNRSTKEDKADRDRYSGEILDLMCTLSISSNDDLWRVNIISLGIHIETPNYRVTQCLGDLICLNNFFLYHDPNVKAFKDCRKQDIIRVWKYKSLNGSPELSKSSSIRTHDLPELQDTTSVFGWFKWKDAAEASLKVDGLHKIITDRTYSMSNSRLNAVVDGLLIKALSQANTHYLPVVLNITELEGDGYARWEKLVEINEHPSIIANILTELRGQLKDISLDSVQEYDAFADAFFYTKGKMEYFIKRGEEANAKAEAEDSIKVVGVDNFKIHDWKTEFLDRIKPENLNSIVRSAKEKTSSNVWETYLNIRGYILELTVKGQIQPTGKKRQHRDPKKETTVQDDANGKTKKQKVQHEKSESKNSGDPFHQRAYSLMGNNIDNLKAPDNMKKLFKAVMNDSLKDAKSKAADKKKKQKTTRFQNRRQRARLGKEQNDSEDEDEAHDNAYYGKMFRDYEAGKLG